MLTAKQEDGPYVYTLSSPDGQVFYVGKGRGGRMHHHVKAAMRGKPGAKNDRIRAILAAGQEVLERVVATFDTDAQAVAEENWLLASMSGLLNIAGPRQCGYEPDRRKEYRKAMADAAALAARTRPFIEWLNLKERTSDQIAMYWQVVKEIAHVESWARSRLEAA